MFIPPLSCVSVSLFSLAVFLFLFFFLNVRYWFRSSRVSVLAGLTSSLYSSAFGSVFYLVVLVLAVHYFTIMVFANVPFSSSPMMLYAYVAFNALLVWVPIVSFSLITNFNGYVSHLLPYGAPVGLMLFLPLIEVFSQLLRPLTLTVRFATNLAAGHIMLFMFSYFSVLSSALLPFLYLVLLVLTIMEVFIAFLQSYIFITLLGLYLEESL